MKSNITLVAAAEKRLLITLAQVKTELAITDSASDAQLETFRRRASQAITGYCNRQLARDQVIEKFWQLDDAECLVLGSGFPNPSRTPGYCTIQSVTANGSALAEADYELDVTAGLLYRSGGGTPTRWGGGTVVVAYTAGFVMPDEDEGANLPEEVQGAAMELIKAAKFNAGRDPALRSENILSGLYGYTLFDPSNAENEWPGSVTGPMSKYRRVTII